MFKNNQIDIQLNNKISNMPDFEELKQDIKNNWKNWAKVEADDNDNENITRTFVSCG